MATVEGGINLTQFPETTPASVRSGGDCGMNHPKNYLRVQKWLKDKPVGFRFISRDVAKEANLTGADVGNILKWQDNVRKLPKKLPGNIIVWERVPA